MLRSGREGPTLAPPTVSGRVPKKVTSRPGAMPYTARDPDTCTHGQESFALRARGIPSVYDPQRFTSNPVKCSI